MRFLKDLRVYTDYNYFAKHFEYPEPLNNSSLIYHCYWNGLVNEHHSISLKSLLISQSFPFEVWIWMPAEDLVKNRAFIHEFNRIQGVTFRAYDIISEIEGTKFEQYAKIFHDGHHQSPATQSDGLRMLVLAKYGGIYFDLDVLFLKDLRALCSSEFCYQWSNRPYANTAIMHALRGGPNIEFLLKRGAEIGSFDPRRLFEFSQLKDALDNWVIFPSFLFDPVWICHDSKIKQNNYCNRIDDFFENEAPIELSSFFPHAYTYHWHNRWDRLIRPKSIIGQLSAEISDKFREVFQIHI